MAACDDAVFGAIIGDFETERRCDPWLRAVHSFCGSSTSNWRVGLDPSTVAHVSQAVRARHMTVGAFAFHIMTAKRTLQIGTV